MLVQGGAGAVGVAAIELARWSGAKVIATVSSPEKAASRAPPAPTTSIDYTQDDVAARVMEITGGAASSASSRSTSGPTSRSTGR